MKRFLATLTFAAAFCGVANADDIPLRNWAVPPQASGQLSTLADVGSPSVFVAMTPCRVADTRFVSYGSYGPPLLSAGVPRTFNIVASGCTGIPSGVSAFSLNFTVVGPTGAGILLAWPAGGVQPSISVLNYVTGQTVANAAIVPAGSGTSIAVLAGVHSTNLLIDINGYFLGSANMNTGEFLNVSGTWDGGGGVLYVQNLSTGRAFSINSLITSTNDGSAVINAVEYGTTGKTNAIYGSNASATSGAAGVYGKAGSGASTNTYFPSGVYGYNESAAGGYGVIGVSRSNGIMGILEDSGGAFVRGGRLGYLTYGVYSQGDFGGSGAKYFVEPHPEDPSKVIKYVALEGPESGTYFRGRGRFVGGTATIDVPESFRMVTDSEGITVQITPIGRTAAVAVTRMGLDGIEAESTRDVEFSYLVNGVRRAFKNFQEIQTGTEFRPESPNDRIPAYLTEEAKRRLIANGTYNADGTVNMRTAERLGWVQQWRAEEELRRQDAEKAAKEAAEKNVQATGGVRLLH